MSFDELAEELIKHIGREYESVLRADITARDSNSKRVDKTLGSTYQGLKLATKLASAIFLYSSSGGERGASLGELKLSCADVAEKLKGHPRHGRIQACGALFNDKSLVDEILNNYG